MKREVRLYNVLFPIWLLVFLPSWLWLILIPANYLIDRMVLKYSLEPERRGSFVRANTWKICLAGFLADFAGGLLLFGILLACSEIKGAERFADALTFNHFRHPLALLAVVSAIALSGALILVMDRFILKKSGLEENQANRSAKMLAWITAPYLFLIPSALIYSGRLY